MKQDIILAGVGGQGILSIAYVIDKAALNAGLKFKQAEVHGMAQRGGAVQSHLRISKSPIFSELIPEGEADLLISVEPLETLRYLSYLKPEGTAITSSTPFVNIPDYPNLDEVMQEIKKIAHVIILDSGALANTAGSTRSQNMVMLGAASAYLKIKEELILKNVTDLFRTKGQKVIDMNQKAFELGRQTAMAQSKLN